MTIPVAHYGLHTDESGVMYLHQGRSANNFIGLRSQSPFAVNLRKPLPCPHLINAVAAVPDALHWQQFSGWLGDPLVQAMLPIPKGLNEPIPYLPDPNGEMAMRLTLLSKLCSPIYPVVIPLRKLTKNTLLAELATTNVCPLVLTGVQCEDNAYVNEIALEARLLPRRVIFTGDHRVVVRAPLARISTMVSVEDEIALAGLPLESLGALLLRRYARGERLNSEIVKGNA